jgi:hypothetical protein
MSDQSNPQEIPIKVFASSSRQKMFDSQDEGRIANIIVFKHDNFRGHHRYIFGMERNLNHPDDRRLNDKISSFVVLSGEWKFCRHSNFRDGVGGEFGPGAYRWVEAVGVANDQVSSLRCLRSE